MPKNWSVSDIKPKNLSVVDVKPSNFGVVDSKPKTTVGRYEEATRSYQQTISAGQYMGLPFLLTYRDVVTVTMWEGV